MYLLASRVVILLTEMFMNKWVTSTAFALFVMLAHQSLGQTTRPSPNDVLKAAEAKAAQAFNARQYAVALPLFQQIREAYKSQPDKLAPIDEQIRVCQI